VTKPSRLYSPIGKRREFSIADQVAIIYRATDEDGRIHCEGCGIWLKSRHDYEIDHIISEGLRSAADKRRRLRPADGQLLCVAVCHKAKSRVDKGVQGEAKRREAAELGVKRPGKVKLPAKEKPARKPLKTASGPPGMARRFGGAQ
jgi:hypothetical protein